MNSNTISIKRAIEANDFGSQEKRIKLTTLELPNEMWMKILSYLKFQDVIGKFALVNKHFHGLTLDPSAVKYLQLEDSKTKNKKKSMKHYNKWMEIVKRSKTLIQLGIWDYGKFLDWNTLISETLKNNHTIKALDIGYCGGLKMKPLLISPNVTEALKFAKHLQILKTSWVTFTPDFLDEICKLKSLKKFIAFKSNKSINPEFIERLAFSENPIEEFKILRLSKVPSNHENEILKAINTLYTEKRNTIKIYYKFGLRGHWYDNDQNDHKKCPPLPNLDICKNITTIHENFHEHDLHLISNLPKLENLTISEYPIKDANYVKHFSHMNFSSLKRLYLKVNTKTEYDNIIQELAKVPFPSLERLFVLNNLKFKREMLPPLREKSLEDLIKNIPRMKSVKLCPYHVSEISHQFILNMLKDENVIIVAKGFRANKFQLELEKFLKQMGSEIFEKYSVMKKENIDLFEI